MAASKETSIGVKITADLRNYQKNLQQAQRENRQFKQNVKQELGDVKSLFSDLMRGDFTALPQFFKGATDAAGGFSKGLNGVKVALISTGIGALIVGLGLAIAAVTQYFKGTEEGQIVFAKIMNKIKAYTTPVIDILGKLGKSIVLLFQGKFAEAWDTAAGSIKAAGDNIKQNTANLEELNNLEESIIKRRRQVADLEAKNGAEIAELRNKANDEENYNAQQRLGFITKAIALERELGAAKIALANDEYRLGKLKDDQGDNTIEDTNATLELEREALRIKKETADNQRRMLEKQQSITKEVKAELTERQRIAAIDAEKTESKSLKLITNTKQIGSFQVAKIDTSTLEDMGEFLDQNAEKTKRFREELLQLDETQSAVVDSVSGGFENIGSSIVESLGLAENGLQGFLKVMLQTVVKLLSMALAQSISNAIVGATASGAATGPLAIFTTPAFIATAIGGVMAAFAAIPKFNNGGVVSGASYFGDKNIVRVNSGEEIITRKDPRHRYNNGTGTTDQPETLPADVKLMDDHILISYTRALARRRART